MNKQVCLLLSGMALVAGCTMIPKYERPAAPVPADLPAMAPHEGGRGAAQGTDAASLKWQDVFTDARLQKVIATALAHNRDLRLAVLNVERARGLYGIQRATLLPAVNASGIGTKKQASADLVSGDNARITEQYEVNLGVASWEIDLFGRIRSLKTRALEEYLATEQARRGAQILLVSSVANAYLTFAADEQRLALAEATLAAQQKAYALIKRRHEVGLANDVDLFRVQTQVDAARGDIARFRQQVLLDENALSLLMGTPVPRDLIPSEPGDVVPPKAIEAGVSSEVLLRRPDVLQAENQLKAANADIGAARAAFFPRISLTAAFGSASSELSGLFKSGTDIWNFSPQVVMPIFDARTWSAHRVSKVQREIAVTQYEKAIQSAFREVADALAVSRFVDEQMAAQQSLTDALAETHRLADTRYAKGIDSYLGVLDAQRSLYAAQQGLVSVRLAKRVSAVKLYAALGGGWAGGDVEAARK